MLGEPRFDPRVQVTLLNSTMTGYMPLPSMHNPIGLDSANGRASASGAGGHGFDPGPRHTKGVKNGTSGYLAWRSAL